MNDPKQIFKRCDNCNSFMKTIVNENYLNFKCSRCGEESKMLIPIIKTITEGIYF